MLFRESLFLFGLLSSVFFCLVLLFGLRSSSALSLVVHRHNFCFTISRWGNRNDLFSSLLRMERKMTNDIDLVFYVQSSFLKARNNGAFFVPSADKRLITSILTFSSEIVVSGMKSSHIHLAQRIRQGINIITIFQVFWVLDFFIVIVLEVVLKFCEFLPKRGLELLDNIVCESVEI